MNIEVKHDDNSLLLEDLTDITKLLYQDFGNNKLPIFFVDDSYLMNEKEETKVLTKEELKFININLQNNEKFKVYNLKSHYSLYYLVDFEIITSYQSIRNYLNPHDDFSLRTLHEFGGICYYVQPNIVLLNWANGNLINILTAISKIKGIVNEIKSDRQLKYTYAIPDILGRHKFQIIIDKNSNKILLKGLSERIYDTKLICEDQNGLTTKNCRLLEYLRLNVGTTDTLIKRKIIDELKKYNEFKKDIKTLRFYFKEIRDAIKTIFQLSNEDYAEYFFDTSDKFDLILKCDIIYIEKLITPTYTPTQK